MNRVNEVKITPGSRVWPVAEYVINARTEARTGTLMATALFAARMTNIERMYLKRSDDSTTEKTRRGKNVPHFPPPII